MVTVLYFGGDEICVTKANAGVNGTHVVAARASEKYGGIINGQFVSPDEVAVVVSQCVKKVGGVDGGRIYVSVPSSFYTASVYDVSTKYAQPQKFTAKHADDLMRKRMPVGFAVPEGFTLIRRSAVYYKVDDGRPMLDAVGEVGSEIAAQVSTFFVSDVFINVVSAALAGLRVKHIVFLPVTLAEGRYLIDVDVRDGACVLISSEVGAVGVSVVCGDCLVAHEAVNVGLAHCINDICVVMKVGYARAREYLAEPTPKVKDIIMARLEDIAERIFGALNAMDRKLFKKPMFICGGNLDAQTEARAFWSTSFDVKITQCVCPFTAENSPEVSRDAVVNLALRY